MLNRVAFVLLYFFGCSVIFAESDAVWIQVSSRQFGRSLLEQVESDNIFQPEVREVPFETVRDELTSIHRGKQNRAIFLQCSLRDYETLLKAPQSKLLISDLQMELLNGHLVSFPFYLYGQGQNLKEKTSKLDALQIAFLTLPFEGVDGIEEADLLTMLSETLSKPKSAIHLYPERDAYTAAKGLFDGHYHLVGIYEDEPSSLEHELQINLVEELHAPSARMLHIEDSSSRFQLYEVSPQRLKYVLFAYQNEPILPMIAIVQKNTDDFPVVLSNIRSLSAESYTKFSRVLSNAYFLMVPGISNRTFPDERVRQKVQHLYLLNAYLNDPENKYKGLGFLGYLLLMKDRKWENAREKEAYEEKCALLQRKLNIDRTTAKSLFEWLNVKMPRIEKRELFTDDVSRLYQNALEKIEEGIKGDSERRKKSLQEALRFLAAAMLQGDEPRNVKGSRGLWSVADYNPYYQLGRIMIYLEKEKQ